MQGCWIGDKDRKGEELEYQYMGFGKKEKKH